MQTAVNFNIKLTQFVSSGQKVAIECRYVTANVLLGFLISFRTIFKIA
jgi:hypothetical protein